MLAQILNDLIASARTQPGRIQSRKLKGNLHIYIVWNEPFYTMTLTRDNQSPSAQEIKTCIAYLPKEVDPPAVADVRETTFKDRPALAVDFATAKYVQDMFI